MIKEEEKEHGNNKDEAEVKGDKTIRQQLVRILTR